MNDLIIENKLPKLQQSASFVCAVCLALWSIYISFTELLASRYSILFYLAIAGLLLAVFTILSVTIWLPKPIFTISSESLVPNLPNQSSLKPILWHEILDVNIGLNFFKITLKSNKSVGIDLSSLRYYDLKDVKSKVIEYCEAKDIPYKNAGQTILVGSENVKEDFINIYHGGIALYDALGFTGYGHNNSNL